MPKVLLDQAVRYFNQKGDTAITKNLLYTGCRSGRLPHLRAGNRYIVDTEELEKFFKAESEKSIQSENNKETLVYDYGKLRKVNA